MSAPPGLLPEHFPARWASDWGEDPFGLWQAFTYRGVRQGFRWMPPGRFLMGSPLGEHGRGDDERQHEVILTRGFWLAETACTQALWRVVIGDGPSRFNGGQRPVEQVSWDDAQKFIARLNAEVDQGRTSVRPGAAVGARGGGQKPDLHDPELDLRFRLPTEAQWEYACRAGTTTPFSFGENITPDQVNYDGDYPYRADEKGLYRQQTVDVASLPANPWGLYEMHGNVWEWCQDWSADYPAGTAIDPVGPATGERRVVRGGGWINDGRYVRSACRDRHNPEYRNHNLGFRLALGPEPRQA